MRPIDLLPERASSDMIRLPDGSGCFVLSLPLPRDHWLFQEGSNESPMPMRVGNGTYRETIAAQVKQAARYAIRASTRNGKDMDFDPDAMVQNMVIGLLGYWTHTGFRGT